MKRGFCGAMPEKRGNENTYQLKSNDDDGDESEETVSCSNATEKEKFSNERMRVICLVGFLLE